MVTRFKFKDYKIIPPLKQIQNNEEERFTQFLKSDNEFLPIFEEYITKNDYLREVLSYIFESKFKEFFDFHIETHSFLLVDLI